MNNFALVESRCFGLSPMNISGLDKVFLVIMRTKT